MENPRFKEQKIIKDIRNLFSVKKEQNDTAVKDKQNYEKLEHMWSVKKQCLL